MARWNTYIRKVNQITIKEHCHENWDKMTPNEQGKHCLNCQKTVHEVSHLSNQEIREKYIENDGNICIRITEKRARIAPKAWYVRWRLSLVALLISLWVSAQNMKAKAQELIGIDADTSNHKYIDTCIVTGQVLDSLQDNTGVPFAFIQVTLPDSSTQQTIADASGKFTITINKELNLKDSLTIKCKMLTYDPIIHTSQIKDTVNINFYLSESHACLNQVVVRGKKFIQGNMVQGIMWWDDEPKIYNKHYWDQYDTKTYHHDEIIRYNLGRD